MSSRAGGTRRGAGRDRRQGRGAAVAAAVFGWVSWRLWPARIFALPEEIAGWQRRFEAVGRNLLGLVTAEFVLASRRT